MPWTHDRNSPMRIIRPPFPLPRVAPHMAALGPGFLPLQEARFWSLY